MAAPGVPIAARRAAADSRTLVVVFARMSRTMRQRARVTPPRRDFSLCVERGAPILAGAAGGGRVDESAPTRRLRWAFAVSARALLLANTVTVPHL